MSQKVGKNYTSKPKQAKPALDKPLRCSAVNVLAMTGRKYLNAPILAAHFINIGLNSQELLRMIAHRIRQTHRQKQRQVKTERQRQSMSNNIQLTILGSPKAQKRAKACQIAGHINIYDPSSKDKGDLLRIIQDKAPEKPFSNPIVLTVCYFMPRPKGHYGTGKNTGKLKDNAPVWHTKKPDVDNLAKILFDVMSKVFFYDDSQICKLTVLKIYDEKPRTEILIEELQG